MLKMLKETVGMVTEEEKKQALEFHERKLALGELLVAMPDLSLPKEAQDELSERIAVDTEKTTIKLKTWWDDMHQKYNWKSAEGRHWNIDFQTNEIRLMTK
jgi:CXXX repeat modification system protein